MSSTQLFKNASASRTTPKPDRRPGLPAWWLPVALVLAFGLLFAMVFRDRLLPAQKVSVSPAILVADIESPAESASETVSAEERRPDYTAPMAFQAAGWFEPDPLPIRATALIDGVVDEVHVLEGQTVEKGQLLANLISEDAELVLQASERALDNAVAEYEGHLAKIPAVEAEAAGVLDRIKSAEARLAEASDRLSRMRTLSQGTISDQELTAARLAVDSQTADIAALKSEHAAVLANLGALRKESDVFKAKIATAEVTLEESQLAHRRTEIVSPVDGVVLELMAAPGQKKMLRMDDPDSATIAVLFESGKLQARVDVPLADASGLSSGQLAIITSDFLPNAEFQGKVTRIVGSADLQRNTLQAKVRVIDPDSRLRPEMLCRVKFLQQSQNDEVQLSSTVSGRAVMVPEDCLFGLEGENAHAWVVSVDGERAERRTLEIGRYKQNGHVMIRNGVLAGELLIKPPHAGLDDGQRIQISQVES